MENQANNMAPPMAPANNQPMPPAPYPVEQPQKKSPVAKILIIVFGCIAVFIIGMILLFSVIMSAGSKEPSAFVEALANGNYNRAYGYFSSELKDVQSFDQFSAQVKTLSLDSTCKFEATSTEMSSNTKETSGMVKCANKSYRAEFSFINTNDGFKLVGYSIK